MGAALLLLMQGNMQAVFAAPLPGGTLDPLMVPKYVTPLVIPPEMPKSPATSLLNTAPQPAAEYNIAVRQFKQQILPAANPALGVLGFPATTIWSYGRAEDVLPANFTAPVPLAQGISFNYPSFTVEATSGLTTRVRWINDLKDPLTGNFLPHLLPGAVDQTLHWANPPAVGCTGGMNPNRTDCSTSNPLPYTGPVPLVTHLHGAHVNPQSDGYPEAWWLPGASNLAGFTATGSHFGQFDPTNTVPGSAFFGYENTQPATTLWYHDHALGMTRLNVYAGPAGFWLIRGGANGDANVVGKLPGPAPAAGAGDPNFDPIYRGTIREIPLAIQDRSFNLDGSLFYPASRLFFDGFAGPYAPTSDIAPIWNPEAFFNTMVVNGSTWPKLEVAPAKYRFRLLNGCNSRFLNLALFQVIKDTAMGQKQKNNAKLNGELPFYQIGAEQGFLPQVVQIQTGFATPLPGNGTVPAVLTPAPSPQQALLMGLAERADVIVDFSALPTGTVVRMVNTGPDAPFGGFPAVPLADPSTTGQVMEFVVNAALLQAADALTTPPQSLILPAEAPIGPASFTRPLSLNEEASSQVCVKVSAAGVIRVLFTALPNDPLFLVNCAAAGGVPQAPKAALLGTFNPTTGIGTPVMWHMPITENPTLNSTEEWEFNNLTVDAHPIHVHQVKFQVINRQLLDPLTMLPLPGTTTLPLPTEKGYKDTVIAYPGQVTRIRATFDIAGLYVWHCHIVEHEDNEMMRPFEVVAPVP
jgi:FtsP/CotA-like multicopper oxidase with cupredoxin domain